MSLIPSESYSFPDDFSRTIARARVLRDTRSAAKSLKPEPRPAPVVAQPVAPPPPKPRSAAPPPPKPVPVVPPPKPRSAVPPPPKPAPAAPPPTPAPAPPAQPTNVIRALIPRRPPVRNVAVAGNARVRSPKPFRPIKLSPSARITPEVIVDLAKHQPVAPVVRVEAPAAEFDDKTLGADAPRVLRLRKRTKFTRFLLIELMALAVLVPSAALALSHRFADPTTILIMNLVTIASAFTAALVPILFFAIAPTLPRSEP